MIKRFKHPHKSIFIFAYTYLSMMKIVWPLQVVSLIQVGLAWIHISQSVPLLNSNAFSVVIK